MNVKGVIDRILWRLMQSRLFDIIRPRISRTQTFLIEGKTARNLDLSIVVFANYKNIVHYVAKLAYSEEPQITPLGRVTHQDISSIIADKKPDMVFAEVDDVFKGFFSKTFLILPRVNFSLDISPPVETILARMKRVRRRNIHKIKKLDYTYEVTRSLDKLKYFYDEIYLPFTSEGTKTDIARLTSRETTNEWLQKGELLFVKTSDTYLAGLLYHPEDGTSHCRLIAYSEGAAGQAALFHLIQMAKEKGHVRINYGETSPFLNDGLFFYKKSWGMEMKPKIKNYKVLALRLGNFGEAVQDFLIDNPFIFTDFESLIGLVFLDSCNSNPDSLYSRYYTPGLHKLMILHPEKDNDAYQAMAGESCSTPKLNALDMIRQLAHEAGFETRMFDFSKHQAKPNSDAED